MTDKEFTFILYDLIIGFCHLQELGIWHGKFSPDWVARTTTGYAVMEDPLFGIDESGSWKNDYNPCASIKVHESVASFGVKTAGEDISGNDTQSKKFIRRPSRLQNLDLRNMKEIFFSPEAYKIFTDREVPDKMDVIKNDVYSLGLVLLKVGLLSSVNDIYSREGINFSKLSDKIDSLRKKYPENVLVLSTIEKMLEYDPVDRPDFKQILEKLPDYNDIKNYFKNVKSATPGILSGATTDRNTPNEPLKNSVRSPLNSTLGEASVNDTFDKSDKVNQLFTRAKDSIALNSFRNEERKLSFNENEGSKIPSMNSRENSTERKDAIKKIQIIPKSNFLNPEEGTPQN